MFKKNTIVLVFMFFTFLINSQVDKAKRITAVLCSDSLFGRGYVNDGVEKASHFLAKEFEAIGLEPFLESGYFQPFSFEVNTFPAEMELFIGEKHLIPGKHFVVDPVSGSFKGELNYISLDSSELSNIDNIRNAIQKIHKKKSFNALHLDSRGLSTAKENEWMHEYIPLANYVPIIMTTTQKFTWSVGRQQLKYPFIVINDSVFNENKLKTSVVAQLINDHVSNNVIGYLPAKDEKAKTIVFTAHYDHLGGMGQKTFFPGANDNASGTAMLISLADYFVKNPSNFNMLFIAFAGEEAGLLGSTYFVEQETMPLENIRFLLNLDIMGSGEEGITVVNGKILSEDFDALKSINEEKKYLTTVKARGETKNSDHYPFYKNGVPAFFIYTMGTNKNYHDIFDTHEALSFQAYNNIVKLLIDFVAQL